MKIEKTHTGAVIIHGAMSHSKGRYPVATHEYSCVLRERLARIQSLLPMKYHQLWQEDIAHLNNLDSNECEHFFDAVHILYKSLTMQTIHNELSALPGWGKERLQSLTMNPFRYENLMISLFSDGSKDFMHLSYKNFRHYKYPKDCLDILKEWAIHNIDAVEQTVDMIVSEKQVQAEANLLAVQRAVDENKRLKDLKPQYT